MPMSYMGTKRHLAPTIRTEILDAVEHGRVVDLFAGMGSVVASLSPDVPVVANDFLAFTTAFSKGRFLPRDQRSPLEVSKALTGPYVSHRSNLVRRFRRRTNRELSALDGQPRELANLMDSSPHVGNSAHYRAEARRCSQTTGPDRYVLTTLYFSGSYFSTQQAIDLDAIRFAIDSSSFRGNTRQWLLAAWLNSAGILSNSPGHTAQFLRPNSEEAFRRIQRSWQRSVWETFCDSLDSIRPIGTKEWRSSNKVTNSEAIRLLSRLDPDSIGAVYADPPYTKDQYERYYHVLETLYRYNFPASQGRGRTPQYCRTSDFSLASAVEDAFRRLFERCRRLECTLVLSYPTNGLLLQKGIEIEDMADGFRPVRRLELDYSHSTMGASKGKKRKEAQEQIYVFKPR